MANEHVFRQAEARKKPVALSAEEAQDAARLIRRLLKDDPKGSSSLVRDLDLIDAIDSSPSSSAERNSTVQLARRTFLARRARGRFVGGAMFGEPAWDMLLALYITEASERQSVTNLVGLSGVPATTALRWIDHLVSEGFASRRPHMTDRRMSFIEITDKGRENLDAYFSALLEKGFADL
jgi:DNA-binding MarR family transcriptional regulator